MPVLERSALADSPLADLHAIAGELGVDGFRRLRKDDLIDAIIARQGGESAPARDDDAAEEEASERPRRRRGGRGRGPREDAEPADEAPAPARRERAPRGERRSEEAAPARRERAPRGERRPAPDAEPAREREREDRIAEGVVELMPNGSGFVRVKGPEPSDGDVYVSAAQVRRCELVDGDRVAGPVRPPRRSERYASLVRIDVINGEPADQAAPEGVRFDELPAAFPSERLALDAEDQTVKAIEWLTPIGRGSRVTIAGPARAGKSETLRRLAAALAGVDGVECSVVLAAVRPEEISEWASGPIAPTAAVSFAGTADAQGQAVEQAIEHGRRVAARGGDAVVLIDTLDGLQPHAARKALAAARNLVDGGSLTVIATASEPLGGETTVVALDAELAGAARFPAIDLLASGTLRPELLVGEAGAAAIAEARVEAAE
jgi:transcription termination factor Rho